MKKILTFLIALAMLASLGACAARPAPATPSPAPTAEPTAEPAPVPTANEEPTGESASEESAVSTGELPGLAFYDGELPEDWAALYRSFLKDNFDVIAALWPDGISGIGFADLDLDERPEMLLFDMGASAAMGVQFFDVADGEVVCVSSVNEAAAAAFGDEYFSPVSVCAQLFGDFRLLFDGEQSSFFVCSANGTSESSWEEVVRFTGGEGGVLRLQSVCRSEIETDTETGDIISRSFYSGGESCDEETYDIARDAVQNAKDLCYEAYGVFQWNDAENYDTSLEGLLVMLDDAAAGYPPLLG